MVDDTQYTEQSYLEPAELDQQRIHAVERVED